MWSGGTGGSGNNSQWSHNQWSFNASSYAHLPADQVDWAALAQQWIQMKDTQQHHHQVAQFPDPGHQLFLNAPQFSTIPTPNAGFRIDNNAVPQPVDPWTTAIQEQQHIVAEVPLKEEWSAPTDSFPPTDFSFQHGSYGHHEQQPPPHHHHQTDEYGEYWNGPHMSGGGKKLHHPKREYNSHQQQHDVTRTTQELDAIRRKSLPAWIREGLEKVEREKRKKQEKEEQDALKAQILEAQKSRLEKESLENHTASKWTVPPTRNDLLVDDKIDDEKVHKVATPSETLKDKLRLFLTELNKEEHFDQLMLCVRRQLTAILLDGTNEVMATLANAMLDKYKRKASQVKKIKAVASLKSELGGFGLTSYDGSDSEDDSALDSGSDDTGGDTEEEISNEIERKKQIFLYVQNLRLLGSEPKSPESPDRHKTENSADGTAGDSSKVQEKDSSTSPSNGDSIEEREGTVDEGSAQAPIELKKEKVSKNIVKSHSPSSHERSRSRSVSCDRVKRNRKSRSKSREKRRFKRSRSSSRDRKKSKKSRSRSKSREGKRSKRSRSKSRERKRSKKSKSRSKSREKRRHKRSRSRSTEKKKTCKSHSRSKSRERERRNPKRSSSSERKSSKRSRSTSRSRKSSKKSRSKSRERRVSKRSRPHSRSRDVSSRVSKSRSVSSDGWEHKRSGSKDRKRNNKKSDSRSKSHERKSGNGSKSRDSKKRKKSRSRSESSDKTSKYD
ncbi:unnamed protein product [Allacma fusca]|uniref:Arginine/serine-rich protein PNISR n=1 Tax=Allacma fusca TaxID=39272 RepID=A0A8J2KHI2_9HEXA|nr:unnamed protein product [Allacma fusca]